MAKIVHRTLRQEVVDAIRMNILTGAMPPGQRIVEQEMAAELGVSRGPVREALRQIEQEGLIQYTSHVGCTVKQVTDQDVYEIYLLRAQLEALAVRLCQGKFRPETLSKLERIVERMDSLSDEESFDQAIDCDNAFHGHIVREAGLERLHRLWQSMNAGNTIIFYAGIRRSKAVVRNQHVIHQQVLDALRSGEEEGMVQALTDHYMSTIRSRLRENGCRPEDFNYQLDIRL